MEKRKEETVKKKQTKIKLSKFRTRKLGFRSRSIRLLILCCRVSCRFVFDVSFLLLHFTYFMLCIAHKFVYIKPEIKLVLIFVWCLTAESQEERKDGEEKNYKENGKKHRNLGEENWDFEAGNKITLILRCRSGSFLVLVFLFIYQRFLSRADLYIFNLYFVFFIKIKFIKLIDSHLYLVIDDFLLFLWIIFLKFCESTFKTTFYADASNVSTAFIFSYVRHAVFLHR